MIKCTNLPPPRSLTSVVRPYIVQCRYSARRIFVILFKWSLEVYWSKVEFYGTGTNCYWRGWCDLRRGLSSFIHGDAPISRQYLRCRGMTFYIHLYSPFRQKKTSTQTTKIEKKHRKNTYLTLLIGSSWFWQACVLAPVLQCAIRKFLISWLQKFFRQVARVVNGRAYCWPATMVDASCASDDKILTDIAPVADYDISGLRQR